MPPMDKLDKAIQEAEVSWKGYLKKRNATVLLELHDYYHKLFIETRGFWYGLRAAKMILEGTIPG